MRAQPIFGAAAICMLAAVGCERSSDHGTPSPKAEETEREPVAGRDPVATELSPEGDNPTLANVKAAKAITKARCEREARCGNVGQGKKYASTAACTAEVGEKWRKELVFGECYDGVVDKQLGECLTEIRNEDCANPFDTLGRLAACREADLCLDVP